MPFVFAIAVGGFFAGLWTRSEFDADNSPPLVQGVESAAKAGAVAFVAWLLYQNAVKGRK